MTAAAGHDGAASLAGGPHSLSRPSRRALARGGLLAGLIYVVFVLLIGLPLALVLVQAILPGLFDPAAPNASLSLAPLQQIFASSRVALSILHSLELASTVAVTATALGALFAFVVQRCNVPMRGLIATVPWLIFLTPSYLKALAWVLLMSPGGYLAQIGMPPEIGSAFFRMPGLVFVHTLSLFPLASFVIGAALVGLGSEFEDAARLSGAPPLMAWFRINGPLLAPALALSAIAIFAEVLSDFGLASTIAKMSSFGVLTYGIYAAASDYPVDFPSAGAQSLVLLALVMLVVLADRVLRRQAHSRLISGRSKPARIYDLKQWRWPLTAAVLSFTVVALVLPVAAIAARSLSRTLGAGLQWSNLTIDNLAEAIAFGSSINSALARSLGYACVTALIACGVGLVLAMRLDQRSPVMRPIVLGLSLGAVAIPGIVLGFGYILLWNRVPGFKDWPLPHYGDGSLLVTGYVAAALPYCLVILVSATGQLAPNLNDAARLLGVGATRRLLRITLPLVSLAVMTAFLLTFIRTVFELPISQMLIPLSGPPAPPVILRLFSHDQDGPASALSLASMLATGAGAALVWLVASRFLVFRGTRGGLLRAAPTVTATREVQ